MRIEMINGHFLINQFLEKEDHRASGSFQPARPQISCKKKLMVFATYSQNQPPKPPNQIMVKKCPMKKMPASKNLL